MKPLEKTLRNKLEKTVKEARDIAEAAARASLEQLGVGEASPFAYLSEDQKELRRKLRAHGRQLGDQRNPETGAQEISQLVEEVAYEHWHRMLFARFLAENNLLMYPDPVDPIAVTLEECEDMAVDEGAKNGWELASRYAARMLPQIFRPDSPVFQLILPPEHQQKLERLLADLPYEVFNASDSLGWVYQFWQAKKKDEVNDSGVKIGSRELPAVTQLFTEPYMVSFLLDNSLGAWWAAHRLTSEDLRSAASEEELRQKASIPGVPLDYLRFVKTDDGVWTPAAGTFDGWPNHLSELKTLDPCSGSGHFLVSSFLMLVPMRMEMEGLSAKDAVDAVLNDNLHGLEIDQRCVELAAFALALSAWCYPGTGGYRPLPEMNLACSGLTISTKKEDWLALAGDNNNLCMALEELYNQFKNANVLGSLVNPEAGLFRGTLVEMEWDDIAPILTKALSGEKDCEKTEMGVVAQGIVKATKMISDSYNLIFTNPPYLGDRKQSKTLKEFCYKQYPKAKNELATVLMERSIKLLSENGLFAGVMPQNWIFLKGSADLRKYWLKHICFKNIARVGGKGFSSPQAQGAYIALVLLENINVKNESRIACLDAYEYGTLEDKVRELIIGDITQINQLDQLKNPDARLLFDSQANGILIGQIACAPQGIKTGDDEKWRRRYWEVLFPSDDWRPFLSTVAKNTFWGGRSYVIDWSTGGQGMIRPRKDNVAVGNKGVAISQMGQFPCTLYAGELYDSNIAPIVPKEEDYIEILWRYFSSPEFHTELRKIDKKRSITNATFLKVPLQNVEVPSFALPKPFSEDPTQWIFHGHPTKSYEPLQVAVVRLIGYRWPAELDAKMELSDEARTWVKKCDELIPYADEDGIVCIPPVRGEASAADQLLNLLAAAYGESWSNDKLSELLKQADHAGKPLETWLREKFFTQHCKLFQHRPFIWHIWDGLRDGFGALVNYHKLDKKLLETLIYTYLGDWISRQKQDIANGVDGSQEKLDAAEGLKKKLELILEGEAPYDIFVRWKPIEKQPIGWDPDLNDGVRLNIRPFMSVPDMSKKGAGVLRDKPNINWNKDRGTDVESAPWYNPDPKKHPNYKGKEGERINDYHLSLKQKKEAREAAK